MLNKLPFCHLVEGTTLNKIFQSLNGYYSVHEPTKANTREIFKIRFCKNRFNVPILWKNYLKKKELMILLIVQNRTFVETSRTCFLINELVESQRI